MSRARHIPNMADRFGKLSQLRRKRIEIEKDITRALQASTHNGTRPGLVLFKEGTTQERAVFLWGMYKVAEYECLPCRQRGMAGTVDVYRVEDGHGFKEAGEYRAFCPDCAVQLDDNEIHLLEHFGIDTAEFAPEVAS